MKFDERITKPMKRLSHSLVEAGYFGTLENVANFMVAISSGRWNQLPNDEQLMWLKRLSGLLGARGLMDSWDGNDSDLSQCHSILDAQIKALERGK